MKYLLLALMVVLVGCASNYKTEMICNDRFRMEYRPEEAGCACGYWKEYLPSAYEKYCLEVMVKK